MKTKILLLAAVSSFILHHSAFGQGALTPPGAPAPTMVTLAQMNAKLDPRTPIATNTTPGDASDSYIISQPGSYYLTTNITGVSSNNAIKIAANNVTLDLGGFAIQGVVQNVNVNYNYGIYIPNAQTNIAVRNGNVAGWTEGILSAYAASAGLVFENLHFANCYQVSTADAGIITTGAANVRHCSFENCNDGCVLNNHSTASGSLITGCIANNCGTGIELDGGGIISGCTANNCSFYGIYTYGNSSAITFQTGIAISDCTVTYSSYGLVIEGSKNRIDNNHITGSGSGNGIYVSGGTNNIIIRNSVEGYGGNNYFISGTQITGPIITTTGTITNSNPWANFSF